MTRIRSFQFLYAMLLLFCSAGFVVFIFWFQHRALARETARIADHAQVIAGSLWTYETVTPTAYLTLAAQSNAYRRVLVEDTNGDIFLDAGGYRETFFDRIFLSTGLMRTYTIATEIVYEGRFIGTIAVDWIGRTTHVYVYVLLCMTLVMSGLWLMLTIWHLNRTLENRVRLRTAALEDEIDGRIQVEKHLAESKKNLKVAMDLAKLVHWEYDALADTFTFNDQFYAMYATTAHQQGGYEMSSQEYAARFLPEEEIPLVSASVEACLSTDDPSFSLHLEHRIKRGDGEERFIAVRVRIIKDEAGRTVKTYGVNQDFTDRIVAERERISLEERLRQSQKREAIGTLAGGIAHDFNNLIGVIMGHAELMQLEGTGGPTLGTSLQQILIASQRAKQLVRQILAYSRRTEQKKQVVSVKGILKETIDFLRASLPSTIRIDNRVQQDGVVMGDSTQLQQIIINLSTNAAHAMEKKGGTLQIALDCVSISKSQAMEIPDGRSGEFLRLSVSDDGDGIAPENLNRIFDPYFTTKEVGKGTGLGLSVVHGIVLSHGGFIQAGSRIGEGSRFDIYLPRADEIDRNDENEPALCRGSETILMVDDEDDLVELGRQILTRLGYRVAAFFDPLEAMAAFSDNPGEFDLVITDMTMPRLTGLDLIRRMLQIRPEMKIILCTGYSDRISTENAAAAGIHAFLAKPYNLHEIGAAIRTALS